MGREDDICVSIEGVEADGKRGGDEEDLREEGGREGGRERGKRQSALPRWNSR